MENISNSISLIDDILPIFVSYGDGNIISAQGTGFLISNYRLITCWHCIKNKLEENQKYVVAKKINNGYKLFPLGNIEQFKKNDIGIASVGLEQKIKLMFSTMVVPYGTNVFTFGYPDIEKPNQYNDKWLLKPRYFEGYIVRDFFHDYKEYGEASSFELNFPALEGISGAPLIEMHTNKVIGIIYSNYESITIKDSYEIERPEGKITKETCRIVNMGLSYHVSTIKELKEYLFPS